MIQTTLHDCFCKSNSRIAQWYCEKLEKLPYPIYSSYDIRNAGFKIANVDGNIYPAGFNNICGNDQDHAGELFAEYIRSHYGTGVQKILLITEEHTNNPYYWDNVFTLEKLITEAGAKVRLAAPRKMAEPWNLTSAQGHTLKVFSGDADDVQSSGFTPDLIVSNNDFSLALTEWSQKWQKTPLTPPRELGWYQRKKSRYFNHYNRLATEFAELVSEDPFLFNIKTEAFPEFSIEDFAAVDKLKDRVDQMLAEIRTEYTQRGIHQEPFLFVKNNSGTYGLAVVRVSHGQDLLDWNSKTRKKMKAAKGGRDVTEVILQEGIPSLVQSEGIVAEPVIYMIGSELAGGFLRTHAEKNPTESLNSPGAVFKRLCMSDLIVSLEGHPLENVYGWSARLGLLAIAHEAQEMDIHFKGWM